MTIKTTGTLFAFIFIADSDPTFHFNADPDPAHQKDANLRPRVSSPPQLHFKSPRLHCFASTALYRFIIEPLQLLILTSMRAWIQLFTLTRIRIQLPKKIEPFNTGQGRIVDTEISVQH
jgi:hypothetical protein